MFVLKRIKGFFNRIREIFSVLWHNSKAFFLLTVFVKAITLVNSFALLYVNKALINEIAECIIEKDENNYLFLKYLFILFFVDFTSTVLVSIAQFFLGKAKLLYDDNLSLSIAISASKLDMSYYDTPQNYNEIKQAYKYCNSIYQNFNNIIDFFFQLFAFAFALVLLLRVNIFLAIVAIVGTLPSLFIRKKIKKNNYEIEKEVLKDTRFIDYLCSMLLNKHIIREIQLFGYRSFIRNKIEDEQNECRIKKTKNSLFNAKYELVVFISEKTVGIIGQIILIVSIIEKALTIGDYTYVGGLVSKFKGSFAHLISLFNDIQITDNKYQDYKAIMSREPRVIDSGSLTVDSPWTIEFQGVSFKYPNSDYYAIRNISFTIHYGEKIALVGQNGSGKTTLIKLLLRYYDPTDGSILLNGINIKQYSLTEYRKIFSAMFHETLLYNFSLKDNITLSDKAPDEERLTRIIDEMRLGKEIDNFDLLALYGRDFSKTGYVFSAGQQQRLYASRAMYRKADLYVLDEPAAAMDSLSESHFFETLESLTHNNGLLYITHRFGVLTRMNNIIVMNKGEIVEQGTHKELLNYNGIYCKMYKMQQKEFLEEKVPSEEK